MLKNTILVFQLIGYLFCILSILLVLENIYLSTAIYTFHLISLSVPITMLLLLVALPAIFIKNRGLSLYLAITILIILLVATKILYQTYGDNTNLFTLFSSPLYAVSSLIIVRVLSKN